MTATSYQNIRLLGVVDDGSKFDPRVPPNTATTITCPQGGTVTVEVSLVYNSGVPVDVASLPAWAATLTVVDTFLPDNVRCEALTIASGILVSAEAKNKLRFLLNSRDLRRAVPGRYFFDVWLTSTEGAVTTKWQVIRMGAFVLLAGFAPR